MWRDFIAATCQDEMLSPGRYGYGGGGREDLMCVSTTVCRGFPRKSPAAARVPGARPRRHRLPAGRLAGREGGAGGDARGGRRLDAARRAARAAASLEHRGEAHRHLQGLHAPVMSVSQSSARARLRLDLGPFRRLVLRHPSLLAGTVLRDTAYSKYASRASAACYAACPWDVTQCSSDSLLML